MTFMFKQIVVVVIQVHGLVRYNLQHHLIQLFQTTQITLVRIQAKTGLKAQVKLPPPGHLQVGRTMDLAT